METELIAVLSQAPALVIIVWLVMKQQNGNGNGSTELIRTIARSLEKMADAQAEANRIAEKRAEGFEKWVELQKTQCQQQFVSRNQK
jgi:hypothetical protein|tara:strand:+ start:559 stop:819 length:261 start_codon:yes stop_codon:yes gene_type:complete